MITVVLLITCDPRHLDRVFGELASIGDIRTLFTTTGDYNIVAVLDADDPKQLESLVKTRIGAINGIRETKTMLVGRQHTRKREGGIYEVKLGKKHPPGK